MRKINIILIFTLIGVFLIQDISYALRLPINTSQILRNGQKPEFVYYTRDENGKLLKEPCGFPGYWTVEVKIPREKDTNADVQRMIKSFSLSMQASQREDVKMAKFTVVDELLQPGEGVVIKCQGFYIRKSAEFIIEVIIEKSFLMNGIAKQRVLFSEIAKDIPKQTDLIMPKTVKPHNTYDRKMKKVLVVNLTTKDKIYQGFSSLSATSVVLASLLKEAGYDAVIADDISAIPKDIKDIDMVCISVYDRRIADILGLVKSLKNKKPDIKIAAGGPGVTIIPEHIFSYLGDYVDIFYRGEAEAGFVDVLNNLESSNLEYLSQCPGTVIRIENTYYFNNLISVNRMTEKQLNSRPFDFSLLNPGNLNGSLSLMTSLGCPYSCVFCAIGGGKKHRTMTPEKVIEVALKYQNRLEELGAKGEVIHPDAWKVVLTDDGFLRDPERALKILELWRRAKLKLKIKSFQSTMQPFLIKETNGDNKANIGLIDKVASFKDIFTNDFGIQIGTDALIDSEIGRLKSPGNKKLPYDERGIEEVMAALDKRGIANVHFLVITNADTTLDDLIRTFLKASIYSIKYSHTVFSANWVIVAYTGTAAVNDLIEAFREPLIERTNDGMPEFKEYDFYKGDSLICPENIPKSIFYRVGMLFDNMENGLLSSFSMKYVMLEGLYMLVGEINDDMDSLEAKKWDLYKGISGAAIGDDAGELTMLIMNNRGKLPSYGLSAAMGLNLIGHKLRGLEAKAVHEGVGSSL